MYSIEIFPCNLFDVYCDLLNTYTNISKKTKFFSFSEINKRELPVGTEKLQPNNPLIFQLLFCGLAWLAMMLPKNKFQWKHIV